MLTWWIRYVVWWTVWLFHVIRLYRERDNGKIGGAHLKVKVMHLHLSGLTFHLVRYESGHVMNKKMLYSWSWDFFFLLPKDHFLLSLGIKQNGDRSRRSRKLVKGRISWSFSSDSGVMTLPCTVTLLDGIVWCKHGNQSYTSIRISMYTSQTISLKFFMEDKLQICIFLITGKWWLFPKSDDSLKCYGLAGKAIIIIN